MLRSLQKYSLFVLFILLTLHATGQTERYRVSILTCDPGNELYTTFGHSALRLIDSLSNRDLIFNYGTFSYQTENFYLKFMRGQLPYSLSVSYKDSFLYSYIEEQRSVREQVIRMDSLEVQKLLSYLEENTKPENREYAYDFFFDNCATRLEDVLNAVTQDSINFFPNIDESLTFRDLLDEHLIYMPWSDFGIDLVIGAIADQKADIQGQMFLPSYLSAYIAQAQVGNAKLVIDNHVLLDYEKEEALRNKRSLFTPLLVFTVILLLTLISLYYYMQSKTSIYSRILDITSLSVAGVIGVVICLLWFATDHVATKQNWNIIWLNPLYFFLIPIIYKASITSLQKYLSYSLILANIVCLTLWMVIPQSFHIAFIPMMLTLIVILGKHTFKLTQPQEV